MPGYCEVVVNRPIVRYRVISGAGAPPQEDAGDVNPLGVTFSYAIPPSLADQVAPGHLAEVPFRSGTLQGVVVRLSQTAPPDIDVRPLTAILDPKPVLNPAQISLAHWLSTRTLAHLSQCVWLFVPPGVRRAPQTMVEAIPGEQPPADLDARSRALWLYLQGQQDPVAADELEAGPLQTLSRRGLVRTWQRLAPPRVGPLIDRSVELAATPEEVAAVLPTLGHDSRQADVLLHLASLDDPLPALDEVLSVLGCGQGPIKALARRGWVKLTPRRALVAISRPAGDIQAAIDRLARAPAQAAALSFLREHAGPVETSQVPASSPVLAALEARGLVRRWTEPARVTLALDSEELLDAVLELRGAGQHAAVLDLLAHEEGRVWVGWIYAQTHATLETLRSLAGAGLIVLDEARHWRDPLADQAFVLEKPPRLTPEQESAWQAIRQAMRGSAGAFLLHGVTGSGKTEIYLRAVAEALGQGRGAIVLVPEIALAAQTVQRVVARFPNQVAVWHSDLSLGERFDTWQRVRAGELPVVVGARSALFAPVPNPGVIIVDEEHEPAYKEDRSPRYHAREVALHLGKLAGASVILGSATPDVTTFRRAERGELQLLSLPKRVLAHRQHLAMQARALQTSPARALDPQTPEIRTLPLPGVEVVDLREELKAGNRSIFSRSLQRAMRQTLDAGQQVILFLNRRGAATFVLCRDCGHVLRCSRCEMPFTYHAGENLLVCHHFNRHQANPDRCPACHGSRIRYFGLGTERVEAVVRELFPHASPLRWDLDTAQARGSHAAFLQHFVEGRANVLVGTQMIAKGLDLPRVTLVGVISADTALYLPDFRAAERTFQLLMQVAGRAGRSPLGGRVILQTYNPDLAVIRAAAGHDYQGFYQDELAARREGGYPPFKRLARLIFTGSGADRARREAERMAKALRMHVARRGEPGVEIVGPAPCFYRRLRGQYRWHILLRASQPEELLRPLYLPLGWRVDIDPLDLL